jgi:hypothetical protein
MCEGQVKSAATAVTDEQGETTNIADHNNEQALSGTSSGEVDDNLMEEIPLNDNHENGHSVIIINNNSSTYNNNKEKEEAPSNEIEQFRWWRGGGIKPRSGSDLGVWEQSLEDRANSFTLWWMSYLNPLLSLGSRKVLDAKDVGVPSQEDRAERAYQSAKKEWEVQLVKARAYNDKVKEKWQQNQQQQEKASHKAHLEVYGDGDGDDVVDNQTKPPEGPSDKMLKDPSISISLVVSFGGWRIALAILFQVISAILSFVPVLILNDLVGYFEWYEATDRTGSYDSMAPPWVEVIGLGIVPVLVSILQTRHNAIMAHCGVFVRTAVSTLLYRKALNVSAAGRAKTSTGQVVNMMSNGTCYETASSTIKFLNSTAFFLSSHRYRAAPEIFTICWDDRCCSFANHYCPLLDLSTGGQCHLGWCGIHGPPCSHQCARVCHCGCNETKGTQV